MLHKRYCGNCYYAELCNSDEVCDAYTPLNTGGCEDDKYIEKLIENGRRDFYAEWFRYLELFYT